MNHNLKKCLLLGLGLLPAVVSADINPLDLDALLIRATQTHPLVNAAKADEMAAVEGMKAAKLGLLPIPTISAGHDKDDGLVSTITIRQPLWTGGRLTAQINQSIYGNKAANAYVYEQQNTVAKNTIDIWRSYIYAIALQELYKDSLARLKEFEAMMERRVAQGVSAKIELDLVKNRFYQDQNALQNAIEQERVAGARLAQLIGENLGTKHYNITMKSLTDYAKSQSVHFETWVFGNSGNFHPSVVRQHFQVEASKQEAKAQAAGRYPNIYVQYQHTFEHDNNKDKGKFSLGMSYDPGAGFSSIALTRAANARALSLTQTQEATRRTVMESLQTQYQEFISAQDREQSIKLAIDGAKLVVDSYGRQFIAGRKSWLEVLNAVREHTQYEQQLLEVQSQMVASFYKLQVDFGAMDWQSDYGSMHVPINEFRPYRNFLSWVQTHIPAHHTQDQNTAADGITDLVMDNVDTLSETVKTQKEVQENFVNQEDLWIEPPRDESLKQVDVATQESLEQDLESKLGEAIQSEIIIVGEGVEMLTESLKNLDILILRSKPQPKPSELESMSEQEIQEAPVIVDDVKTTE